jgi:hypothetical protein
MNFDEIHFNKEEESLLNEIMTMDYEDNRLISIYDLLDYAKDLLVDDDEDSMNEEFMNFMNFCYETDNFNTEYRIQIQIFEEIFNSGIIELQLTDLINTELLKRFEKIINTENNLINLFINIHKLPLSNNWLLFQKLL